MSIETLVCTMSAEGSEGMNDMILKTARSLNNDGRSVLAFHIGNPEGTIGTELKRLYDGVVFSHPIFPKNPLNKAKLLCGEIARGVRKVMHAAAQEESKSILYMEGDKYTFVPHIQQVASPIVSREYAFSLAARSPEGFAQFPWVQRILEDKANNVVQGATGVKTDYMYGPRAFNSSMVRYFAEYPKDDWGVFTYPVVRAARDGHRVTGVTVPGAPQPGYMDKYSALMRFPPVQLIWRFMQNIPHIQATKQAIKNSN